MSAIGVPQDGLSGYVEGSTASIEKHHRTQIPPVSSPPRPTLSPFFKLRVYTLPLSVSPLPHTFNCRVEGFLVLVVFVFTEVSPRQPCRHCCHQASYNPPRIVRSPCRQCSSLQGCDSKSTFSLSSRAPFFFLFFLIKKKKIFIFFFYTSA